MDKKELIQSWQLWMRKRKFFFFLFFGPFMRCEKRYGLTKDDWETLFALSGKEERITSLDPKLKAAFTRKYLSILFHVWSLNLL